MEFPFDEQDVLEDVAVSEESALSATDSANLVAAFREFRNSIEGPFNIRELIDEGRRELP